MKATSNVAKNTILLTIGLFSGRFLSVLIIRKMTPLLGTSDMGVYFAATDMTSILLIITNFGLGTLITRELTKARFLTLPFLWSVVRLRWMLGALCYLFLLLFVDLSGYESIARTVWLLTGIAIFVEATSMACDSVLQAHNKVEYQSVGQIFSAIVFFTLAWIWLSAGHGLMGAVWANLISRVVRLVVMVPLMLLKTGPWTWKKPEGAPSLSIRWMMGLGLPLFLSSTFGIIYNKVDSVMLISIVGNDAAGLYGLGHRAYDVMVILPNIFATALFPIMTRYSMSSTNDASRLGERALRFLMVAIFPITLFITFTAKPIIGFLNPSNEFPDSIPILMIVIWALPLMAAQTIFNRLVITAEKERAFIRIGLISMLTNITLNSFLIPKYSYYGASVATLVSVSVSFIMHIQTLNSTKYRPPLIKALLGPIVATTAAWCLTVVCIGIVAPTWGISWFGLPLDQGLIPFLITVTIMVFFYLNAVGALRVIEKKDLNLLQDLIKTPR